MQDENDNKVLFYYGSQVNADGDMLPETFSVFPCVVDQHDAAHTVISKITESLAAAGIDESEGVMKFEGVTSWQEWADIPLNDEVKQAALIEGVMGLFVMTITSQPDKLIELVQKVWAK